MTNHDQPDHVCDEHESLLDELEAAAVIAADERPEDADDGDA